MSLLTTQFPVPRLVIRTSKMMMPKMAQAAPLRIRKGVVGPGRADTSLRSGLVGSSGWAMRGRTSGDTDREGWPETDPTRLGIPYVGHRCRGAAEEPRVPRPFVLESSGDRPEAVLSGWLGLRDQDAFAIRAPVNGDHRRADQGDGAGCGRLHPAFARRAPRHFSRAFLVLHRRLDPPCYAAIWARPIIRVGVTRTTSSPGTALRRPYSSARAGPMYRAASRVAHRRSKSGSSISTAVPSIRT